MVAIVRTKSDHVTIRCTDDGLAVVIDSKSQLISTPAADLVKDLIREAVETGELLRPFHMTILSPGRSVTGLVL